MKTAENLEAEKAAIAAEKAALSAEKTAWQANKQATTSGCQPDFWLVRTARTWPLC